MKISVSKNIEDLSSHVAEWMIDYIHKTLQLQDRFTLALSGGSTPKKLHQLLASAPFKNRIDWQKLHIFWGDERYVPLTDDRNNAKMAFDTLLDHVAIPSAQIHIMRTDIDPATSAAEYEQILKEYFPEANTTLTYGPVDRSPGSFRATQHHSFDLIILGLGDNAHTLSLFPGEEVIHEKDGWVKAVFVKEVNMERITLTPPIVNISRRTMFIVSGQSKSEAVSHVLLNKVTPDLYPAQLIQPENGELYWFLDEAAASRIEKRSL